MALRAAGDFTIYSNHTRPSVTYRNITLSKENTHTHIYTYISIHTQTYIYIYLYITTRVALKHTLSLKYTTLKPYFLSFPCTRFEFTQMIL